MKIAVTYENGQVFQHFGHCASFKIYEVENGAIVSSSVVETNGSGHGALADFLENLGVNALICGGIGGGARIALEEADIAIYGGVSGDADEAVAELLAGSLNFNAHACCSHHHHDHECGHHHHDHECDHHHHDHECGHHHHGHDCGCHGHH